MRRLDGAFRQFCREIIINQYLDHGRSVVGGVIVSQEPVDAAFQIGDLRPVQGSLRGCHRETADKRIQHMQPDCAGIEKNASRFEPGCFRAAGLYSNQMNPGTGGGIALQVRKRRPASYDNEMKVFNRSAVKSQDTDQKIKFLLRVERAAEQPDDRIRRNAGSLSYRCNFARLDCFALTTKFLRVDGIVETGDSLGRGSLHSR